jgi:ATP synthase protein I
MPEANTPHEEAMRRLNERAAALDTQTQRPTASHAGEQAVSQAYRIIAELVGGVLIGLALGFVADRVFRTTPWGLIVGVLAGFALSIWLARRTANRLMAMAKLEAEPASSVLIDDEDEER